MGLNILTGLVASVPTCRAISPAELSFKLPLICIASICERPINLGTTISWEKLTDCSKKCHKCQPYLPVRAIQDTKTRLKVTVTTGPHKKMSSPDDRIIQGFEAEMGCESGLHWLTSPSYLIIKSIGNLYDNLNDSARTHAYTHSYM